MLVKSTLLPSFAIGCLTLTACCDYVLSNVNKKVQLDATICRHLFTAKSLYMFQASQHPSSGSLKTVTATSGIGHTVKYKLKIKN